MVRGCGTSLRIMITATLDDGLGHGLEVIRMFSEAAGLEIIDLGLLVTPEKIITACKKNKPDLLGLTVLQFDSEENILMISRNLPERTKIIAGGPVFRQIMGLPDGQVSISQQRMSPILSGFCFSLKAKELILKKRPNGSWHCC